jgi:hypothetical protein
MQVVQRRAAQLELTARLQSDARAALALQAHDALTRGAFMMHLLNPHRVKVCEG